MPKVKIQKTLSVQTKDLFDLIKNILTTDKEVKALEPNLKINKEKSTNEIVSGKVSGSRIKGSFEITSKGEGSDVNIELSLPLMLAPFKGLVQKKIEEKLSQIS